MALGRPRVLRLIEVLGSILVLTQKTLADLQEPPHPIPHDYEGPSSASSQSQAETNSVLGPSDLSLRSSSQKRRVLRGSLEDVLDSACAEAKLRTWHEAASLHDALVEAEASWNENQKRKARELDTSVALTPGAMASKVLVASYPCSDQERLGKWGDGGKWVCLAHYKRGPDPPSVVSVGSRGDTSFEDAVHSRLGSLSSTFDPTLSPSLQSQVSSIPHIRFFNKGLESRRVASRRHVAARRDGKTSPWITVFGLMELLNSSYVDVFKVDCDGCELDVVRDMKERVPREQPLFGQILMEVHKARFVAHTMDVVGNLEALGYRLFHAEPNPFCVQCYELAYIHESLVKPRGEPESAAQVLASLEACVK